MNTSTPAILVHNFPIGHRIIWFLVVHLGDWFVILCIAIGAFVIVAVIFRDWLQSKVGTFLAWADAFVNGKK